ncbi:hypothetical protein [uncultured Marixanthomonas sp.]|uniref:hypothetical protein n=1 Tax=uncultured Marixanthomonas sp. TaxID=757245 RepID=UPI0030DAA702|tara:strand:- start:1107 stop:1571 length:465 start_codon:yes stop_codon:yes gene_type:complete
MKHTISYKKRYLKKCKIKREFRNYLINKSLVEVNNEFIKQPVHLILYSSSKLVKELWFWLKGHSDKHAKSFIVIFNKEIVTEKQMEEHVWILLSKIAKLHALNIQVSKETSFPSFSFYLQENRFSVETMYPLSPCGTKRAPYPAIVFTKIENSL